MTSGARAAAAAAITPPGTTQCPCTIVASIRRATRQRRVPRQPAARPAASPATPRRAARRRPAALRRSRTRSATAPARSGRGESGRRRSACRRVHRGCHGSDDVDLVAARGQALRDRLHEGADACRRETAGTTSPPSPRAAWRSSAALRAGDRRLSRHGVSADSSITLLDIFD